MPAPTLTTKRMQLRHWTSSDLQPFADLNADPNVTQYFPSTLTREESDALAASIQEEMREKEFGLWAVEVLGEASFIGFVGLHEQNFDAPFCPCIEIGWRLASQHQGNGYAFEAAAQVLDYAFNQLELKDLVSFTSVHNQRSRKLMERLGLQRDPGEDFNHSKLPENHPLRPHVLYRMTRQIYETLSRS